MKGVLVEPLKRTIRWYNDESKELVITDEEGGVGDFYYGGLVVGHDDVGYGGDG